MNLKIAASMATIIGTVIAFLAWLQTKNLATFQGVQINQNAGADGTQVGLNNGNINIFCAPEPDPEPRAALSRMGVSWSYERFQEALRRRDHRVIELFLRGGMHVDAQAFSKVVNTWYDGTGAQLMLKYREAVEEDVCPSNFSFGPPLLYTAALTDPEKTKFVGSFVVNR